MFTKQQMRKLAAIKVPKTREHIERSLKQIAQAEADGKYLICMDEVGWGAIAGPLTVAATHVPTVYEELLRSNGVMDSKGLHNSKLDRYGMGNCDKVALWYSTQEAELPGAASIVCSLDASAVDQLGAGPARSLAFRNAALYLLTSQNIPKEDAVVVIDGAGTNLWLDAAGIQQIDVPKGDDFIIGISLASILAKSNRDITMRALDAQWAAYQFERNVGYLLDGHMDAILQFGLVPGVHRESYCESAVRNHYSKARETKDYETVKRAPAWVKQRGWELSKYSKAKDQ